MQDPQREHEVYESLRDLSRRFWIIDGRSCTYPKSWLMVWRLMTIFKLWNLSDAGRLRINARLGVCCGAT